MPKGVLDYEGVHLEHASAEVMFKGILSGENNEDPSSGFFRMGSRSHAATQPCGHRAMRPGSQAAT